MSAQDLPKLRRTRNRNGRSVAGLWECDIVRMERDDDGWAAEVPMRRIGETFYHEFRAVNRGGVWVSIGRYRKREDAVHTAAVLQSGLYVWRMAYTTGGREVPGLPHQWKDVAEEIAAHPSISGTSN